MCAGIHRSLERAEQRRLRSGEIGNVLELALGGGRNGHWGWFAASGNTRGANITDLAWVEALCPQEHNVVSLDRLCDVRLEAALAGLEHEADPTL